METQPALWATCAIAPITLTGKKCFLIFRRNRLCFRWCPLPLVTGHQWQEPRSVFLTLSLQTFVHLDGMPPEPSLLRAEQPQLSPPSTIWQHSSECSPGDCWPPWPPRHIAGLFSIWCPSGHPDPFLQSSFPVSQPPAYTGARARSSAGAGLFNSTS